MIPSCSNHKEVVILEENSALNLFLSKTLPRRAMPESLAREFGCVDTKAIQASLKETLLDLFKKATPLANTYADNGYQTIGLVIEVETQDQLPGDLLNNSFSAIIEDENTVSTKSVKIVRGKVSQALVPFPKKTVHRIDMGNEEVQEICKAAKKTSTITINFGELAWNRDTKLRPDMIKLLHNASDSTDVSINFTKKSLKTVNIRLGVKLLFKNPGSNSSITAVQIRALCSSSQYCRGVEMRSFNKDTSKSEDIFSGRLGNSWTTRTYPPSTEVARLYPSVSRFLLPATVEEEKKDSLAPKKH